MSKSIARAAVIIMVMNLASRLLGFIRETVIAKEYGATYLTDAYLVAYTLPYFLQAVLGMALVTSIVPAVTRHLVRGDEKEAWKIASITLNWTVLFMCILTILGMAGARGLVNITAPGFDDRTSDLAVVLTLIMFPSLIFMGAGMLITGILNARKSFAIAAFAPGLTSLIIIASVLFLGRYGVRYLAWGTLLGMLGTLMFQIPALKKVNFRYTWDWSLNHPDVKELFINLIPIFLGTAVNQLYLAFNRYFASGLTEGSISALNYAGKLMNLPMGIFVLAVSSAIFPTLAEQAVRYDLRALSLTLIRGLKLVLLVTFPAAAGLMALKNPIVKLLFERGAFDSTATQMTAEALFYFSLGMFAMAANMVITRAYYALRDVKTPLYIGLLSIFVNIGASIVLVRYMGHSGLALANTLAAVFNTLVMYFLLGRHLPDLYIKDISASSGKSVLASIISAVGAAVVYGLLAGSLLVGGGTRILVFQVFFSILAGIVIYALAIVLLREKEVTNLLQRLRSRLSI